MQFVLVNGKIEATHVYPKNADVGLAKLYRLLNLSANGESRGIAMEVEPSDPRAAQGAGALWSIVYETAEQHQRQPDGRACVLVTEDGKNLLNRKNPGYA